jgi:hypothetical protein
MPKLYQSLSIPHDENARQQQLFRSRQTPRFPQGGAADRYLLRMVNTADVNESYEAAKRCVLDRHLKK